MPDERTHDEHQRTDPKGTTQEVLEHEAPSVRPSEQSNLIPDVAMGSLEPEGNVGQEGEERPQELEAAERALRLRRESIAEGERRRP